MFRIWVHKDRYDSGRGNLGAWINRITRNYLLNAVKRDQRLVIGLDDLPEPLDYHLPSDQESDKQESTQRIQLLNRGWSALNERQRRILILRYFEGCKPSVIAQVCGGNANSIRTEIHRAKKKLGTAICGEATPEEIQHCLY